MILLVKRWLLVKDRVGSLQQMKTEKSEKEVLVLLKLYRKDDKFDYFRTIIDFCVRCEDGFSLDAIWIVLRVDFLF